MSLPLQISVSALMTEGPPGTMDDDASACEQPDELTARRREAEAGRLAGLLRRTAVGDQTAFGELYDATSARIYGTILRTLRSPALSEEAMQEIYLEVWNNARQFDPARGSALSWIMTMAHRRAIDRVRSEQSSRNRDAVYHVQSGMPEHDSVADSVVDSMEAAAVVRCLGTLTEKQRQAIDLAYYQGLSYREVAEKLDTSLPTMKSRIRDGLIGLQKCLGVKR